MKKRELKQRIAELEARVADLERVLALLRQPSDAESHEVKGEPIIYRERIAPARWPDDNPPNQWEPFGRYRVTCLGEHL